MLGRHKLSADRNLSNNDSVYAAVFTELHALRQQLCKLA